MSTLKFSSWQDLNGNEVANSTYPPGLVLVKTQTIGSAVSSVTVTGAFSSTFDNYVISVVTDSASGNTQFQLNLDGSTANYKWVLNYSAYTTSGSWLAGNTTSTWEYVGQCNSAGSAFTIPINGPYRAKPTTIGPVAYADTGATGVMTGWHGVSTSYTGFVLASGGGTFTGGTIRVYGYNNG